MDTNDQENENFNDVSSIKMEIDENNDSEKAIEHVTFSDANESIADIEESKQEIEQINENSKDELSNLKESITDESNTEEIKEDVITPITPLDILIETDNTNINNLDSIITETNINIPKNVSNVIINKTETDYHQTLIPIADIVASDVNNINKKHVTISDILIQPVIVNQEQIKYNDPIILNNGYDIDQISNTNTPSEISYINKIKTNIPISNKSFKHIQQIKPHKKTKNFELDQIDNVYNKLQDYIRNIKIDRTNYILLIVKCVEIIENLNNIASNDRKQLAVKSINRIITVDLNLSPFDNNYIIENIENSIELIITASKYKLKNSQLQKNLDDNDNIIYANAGQIIPSILDKIITIILKKRYTIEKIFTNLGTLVYILILFCEQYPFLNGVEKKNIVIQTMEQLIYIRIEYILKINNDKKTELIQALDSISYITDTLIALQKGKYKVNRKHIMPNKKSFINFLCCK